MKVSVILPCLDEEEAIGLCLDKINEIVGENELDVEVIVVDNGSVDDSYKVVEEKKIELRDIDIKLVYEGERGYGAAYLKGFQEARGKYIFMADCDGSYDFSELPRFITELEKGYDFVIGNRFRGEIGEGAMSFSHKYFGNPILSGILRLFFRAKIRDAHCGMRAIKKDVLKELNLRTRGMEFASEMIIKAAKNNLKVKELPINYYKRRGESKLNSFVDGWRHLRFMLLYSPLFLFFIPGFILLLLGVVSVLWLYAGAEIFGLQLYYHPMFLSSLLIIIGYQLIIFTLFAKTYAITHLGDEPMFERFYKYVTIEKASIFGALMTLSGIVIYVVIFLKWLGSGFGELYEIKNFIIALTLVVLGIQTISSSFMLSILGIRGK